MQQNKIWFDHQEEWQPEEDILLVMLSPPDGTTKWSDIAHAMQTEIGYRIYDPNQIAQRYRRKLLAKNEPWTEDEDKKLVKWYKQVGKKMAFIGKQLSRSDLEVRSRLKKLGHK